MSELVNALPEFVEQDLYDSHKGQAYVWDHVVDPDTGRDIVALFFRSGLFPHGVEAYHFVDTEAARDEAWRLNQKIGLSDDEIVARIDDIVAG